MKEIRYFTLQGKCPVKKWMSKLGVQERRLVAMYIDRLAYGNTGAAKNLKGGLWELRLYTSSGLRVYFTYEGDTIIVLLCGGNKSTQEKDIKTARAFLTIWKEVYYEKL